MNSMEEKIRSRAYELWERAGRTGSPEDHWLQAERELTNGADNSATVEEAPPTAAIEAASAAPASGNGEKAKRKRSSVKRAS